MQWECRLAVDASAARRPSTIGFDSPAKHTIQTRKLHSYRIMQTLETSEIAKLPETANEPKPALPAVVVPPQESARAGSCPTCSGAGSVAARPPGFVYAIGRIEPRFPRISVY